MRLAIRADACLQRLNAVLSKGHDYENLRGGGGSSQRRQTLRDAGLSVTDVGIVQDVVGAVVDGDEGRLLPRATIST